MKIFLCYFFLCLLPTSNKCFAQNNYYKFSQAQGIYTEITGGTILSKNFPSSSSYLYPLPKGMQLYGQNIGNILKIGASGWVISSTTDHFFAYDPFYLLKGFVPKDTTTSLSAVTDITGSDTIVKIQWKNVTTAAQPSTDIFNFQLWMYTNSRAIEFRYGPSSFSNNTDTVQITTVFLSADFQNDYETHQLTGSSTSVIDDFDSLNVKPYFGAVANGTIFRFTPVATNIQSSHTGNISIFPNPVKDILNVKLKEKATYTLKNVMGSVILNGVFYNDNKLDLSSLPSGAYFLQTTIGNFKLLKAD